MRINLDAMNGEERKAYIAAILMATKLSLVSSQVILDKNLSSRS